MRKKKMEISELFNRDLVLERHNCLNPELEELYFYYLNNKGIELQYHKKNLKKYIDEQKKSLYKTETLDEFMKKFDRKQRLLF